MAAADGKKIFELINDLLREETREDAISKLCLLRNAVPDLGPIIWRSFGVVTVLLKEVTNTYPSIALKSLSPIQSNRACNALTLLQCVAVHPDTITAFLHALIPEHLFPILRTTCHTQPLEYLRIACWDVIGALVGSRHPEVISHFLQRELIPMCLNAMESGSELCKTYATFIVYKILMTGEGLAFVCGTYDRFADVAMKLDELLSSSHTASEKLLKFVIGCYLRFCDHPRARRVLRLSLPYKLRSKNYARILTEDSSKHWFNHLIKCLNEPELVHQG